MTHYSITQLPELIAHLPLEQRHQCDHLFVVERVQGIALPPPEMEPWVVRHFGTCTDVQHQTIVKVIDRFTLQGSLYNALRARRPQDDIREQQTHDTLESLIAAGRAQDMFSDPWHATTADPFGRIQGRFSVSASNVAKYDGWHGLVIFDEYHPLRFSREQLHDYFDVAIRWLDAAHATDPDARYPIITWNSLWKAGASLIHGHLQMSLARTMPYGVVERWRRASVEYRQQYDAHWYNDLRSVHRALNLTFWDDEHVWGYATLTPIKDRELVLACTRTSDRTHLWDAVYAALRGLIEYEGVCSFNLAVYLPPYGHVTESWDDMPLIVRIVDRGNPLSRMVNFGAMELFASSVITTDPVIVADRIRSYGTTLQDDERRHGSIRPDHQATGSRSCC